MYILHATNSRIRTPLGGDCHPVDSKPVEFRQGVFIDNVYPLFLNSTTIGKPLTLEGSEYWGMTAGRIFQRLFGHLPQP